MNNKEGLEFINKLYKDLHMSEVVEHTADKSDKPVEKIEKYMERLERTHTQDHLNYLKKLYYEKYVIKEENIPQSYIDYLDKQYFDACGKHMNEQLIQEHKRNIIEDQKQSLDNWIEYFVSEDAKFYPMWAKYWAFQSMLNIGNYDENNAIYNRRTGTTAAPFIELNMEVLAKCIDLIMKDPKESLNDEELKTLVENGSFSKLYTMLLQKNKERNLTYEQTEGKWVKYNQGTEYKKLHESLQGYVTGWCTAGGGTCKRQIAAGDFYVYYTYDKEGNAKIPRIAIRMDGTDRIGEIRGVAKGQNLESHMEDVLEEKLKEFPDREKYAQRIKDNKMLTYVYTKFEQNQELTTEELKFILETDKKIEGFGFETDPRLVEIRTEFKGKIDNRDIMLAAVQSNGWALEYASPELQKEQEIVLAAVKKNYHILKYDLVQQKNERDFILKAVQQNGLALQYVPNFQNDREIVWAAVQQNGIALTFASPEFQNNPDLLKQFNQAVEDFYAKEEARKGVPR